MCEQRKRKSMKSFQCCLQDIIKKKGDYNVRFRDHFSETISIHHKTFASRYEIQN